MQICKDESLQVYKYECMHVDTNFAELCKNMTRFSMIKPYMAILCKAILSKGHILFVWASYTKSWQLMAKFDKLMQSFRHIWAIFVKICPEMAMLCKVTTSSA